MRAVAIGALLVIGSLSVVHGQSSPLMVNIVVDGTARAGMVPVAEPYANKGPWAAVPARPRDGGAPTVSDFRIRTWTEGLLARVMVFAVSPGRDGKEVETQIDTFALGLGESREVTATTRYNARPIAVNVSLRR